MISFKIFLESLRNPSEVGAFKRGVSHLRTVDNRVTEWRGKLDPAFSKYGFKLIGEGKYGAVYENPKYSFIIKVFMRDTAYLKWLNFAKQNQDNPWVPKIRGKVVRLGSLFMAVRLEKLTPGGSSDDVYTADDEGNKAATKVVDFLEANSKLLDLHSGNVMKRGHQTVIVDPLYMWFKGGQFVIDPNDLSGLDSIL